MTDNPQDPTPATPEPEPPHVTFQPRVHKLPRRRSKTWLWIVLGILGVGLLCVGVVVCVSTLALGARSVESEREPVTAVLDAYMEAMAAQDAERAYALFSPRAQRQIPLADIEELLDGNNYMIFEGYQRLSLQSFNISTAVNTDPDVPQGLVAKVNGTITYAGQITGSFNGVLEKVDDQWMLDGIHVTVPPDKLKP